MPREAAWLEARAATELAHYAGRILGYQVPVVKDAEVGDIASGRVCFSVADACRNRVTARLFEQSHLGLVGKMPEHRDGFIVVSGTDPSGGRVIVLAGRRPIGTLYAVYDYLEEECGVGYFQDGEYVPRMSALPVDGLGRVMQARFDDRLHFCWNAHRCIKRYHSFYWTLGDWKREFEWMTKRRMNMLRLDMAFYSRFPGDAFEQAFPEIGPEPEELLYPRMGGWSVEWDWPPEYRRDLTQQMLEYGRRLGIRFIYTLSYGTVPFRFKAVHPEYRYLPGNQYGESREIDPRDSRSYEVEKKYVAKCVELFGTDHLYMYSPYAEIDVGEGSPERNLEMRIEASKGILRLINEVDPEGIWVTDSWDMNARERWNTDRVKKYLDSFPAEKMYLYETSADIEEPKMYRAHDWWHGKRWAFGILHCFAGEEALHGDPVDLVNRVREAATCPRCTGLFMVPEMTHHNIMFWDLATRLAWDPGEVEFDDYLKGFVARRYGVSLQGEMHEVWKKVVAAVYWYKERPSDYVLMRMCSPHFPWYQWTGNSMGNVISCPLFPDREAHLNEQMEDFERELPPLRDALGELLQHREELGGNPLYAEDVVVIFRTYASKCFNQAAGRAYRAFRRGERATLEKERAKAMGILGCIGEVLAAVPSYSLNKTIDEACRVPGHHRLLPEIIRNNCINGDYVNNDVYEQLFGQYVPRMEAYFSLLEAKLKKGEKDLAFAELKPRFDIIDDRFRKHGWAGRRGTENPVGLVWRCFGELAGASEA